MKISSLFTMLASALTFSSICHADANIVKAEYSASAQRTTLVANITGEDAAMIFQHLAVKPDSEGSKSISTQDGLLSFHCLPNLCVVTDLVDGDASSGNEVKSTIDENLYSRAEPYDGGLATEVGGIEQSGMDSQMNMTRIVDPRISEFVEAFEPNESGDFAVSADDVDPQTRIATHFVFSANHGAAHGDVRQMFYLILDTSKFTTVP